MRELLASLSLSDLIAACGVIASLITSVIAIIISICSIRQNSKMIEESSRAVIGIYSDSINSGSPMLYLVVKNFGHSVAVITKFECDFDFSNCYCYETNRNYIEDLIDCTIAPNQSRVCRIDYDKVTKPVTFTIEYMSCGKTYSDKITTNLRNGATLPVSKVATKDKELHAISYTLQEMLTKSL